MSGWPETWEDGFRRNAERLDALSKKVDELVNETATEREIKRALRAQTEELSARSRAILSRRVKIAGAAISGAVVGLQIFQAVHG